VSGRGDPKYGRGLHSVAFDADDDLIPRLRGVFRSPAYQPPLLPNVALELLAISRNPDVQVREVMHPLE
jgi:hypothetical protein